MATKPQTPSRTQAQRPTADSIRESVPISFEEEGNLPTVEPRTGYAQKWIRVNVRGDDDRKNIYNAMRKGWSPRPSDTVPVTLRWLSSDRGDLGNVIGTHDMVLMERPVEVNDQERQIKARARSDQIRAVKQNLFNEHRDLGGSQTGFTAPVMESTKRVETGSPVKIQED